MQWSDNAVILQSSKFSESALRLVVLSESYGVYAGIVRGGASSKQRGRLQPGNLVSATWKARLSEHLGSFTIELQRAYAAPIMADAPALLALATAAALAASSLPERHPEPELYHRLIILLEALQQPGKWYAEYIRFEVALLAACGFPLDLTACAATGSVEELIYVSPKSARAVSKSAGAPYADRMLPLPGFLLAEGQEEICANAFLQGMKLTGFFLEHHEREIGHRVIPGYRQQLAGVLSLPLRGRESIT